MLPKIKEKKTNSTVLATPGNKISLNGAIKKLKILMTEFKNSSIQNKFLFVLETQEGFKYTTTNMHLKQK